MHVVAGFMTCVLVPSTRHEHNKYRRVTNSQDPVRTISCKEDGRWLDPRCGSHHQLGGFGPCEPR